jgi:hypothetical protein
MSTDRPPRRSLHTARSRVLLALDLPGLPLEVAQGADIGTLAMVAATWLDTDDRLQAQTQTQTKAPSHAPSPAPR